MATYSNLGIKLITTGDESGTWGTSTNNNFSDVIDEAIAGVVTYNIGTDADFTLTVSDATSSDARHAVIKFTSTTLSATRTCTFAPDDLQKVWVVINSTTGGQSLTFKQGSSGATVTVANGESAIIYSDGAGASAGAITRVLDSFTATAVNATTVDTTNLEVTNVKAKDGTAALSIANSTGKVTVSTELAVDNINVSGNAITSTDTNGNIDLTPNGTGEVNISKVDIDAGAIDGTAIGANSASSGAFTTLSATGVTTLQAGTNSAPALTTTGDTNTGIYFPAADTVGFAEGGTGYKVGFRNVPQSGSDKTTSYTLATSDIGEFVGVGSGGSITIPDATFAAGDVVSLFNNTTGNITITCTITTAYIAGTDSDKASVTLATRGVATILFISGTACVITGNVS
jgi:hypothetical protein